jgi:urease accessory protein
MNAALSPIVLQAAERGGWHGALDVAFERRGDRSTLCHVRHHGPLRLQRPLYPEGDRVCHAIVVHPPGGVAGGDSLQIDVAARERAHALLTTPGAGKLYKAAGRVASVAVRLTVARDSVLEWLPQETIVFDGADARLALDLDLTADARALAWEIVVLGRMASGETFRDGRLRQRLRVRRDGRLEFDEASDVRGGSDWLAAAPGWQHMPVAGTLIAAGVSVDDALLETARAALADYGTRAAVTRLAPGLLAGRYLGPSAGEARAAFAALWHAVRPAVAGVTAQAPRIWST